jgi:hypothetical protein
LADLIAKVESAGSGVLEQGHPHAVGPRPDRIAQTDARHSRPVAATGRFAIPDVDPIVVRGEVLDRLEPVVALII